MIVETFVTGPLETNTYLLADPERREAIVIDPGGGSEAIVSRMGELEVRCVAIVNTHGHFDHVSGNRELKASTGAPILIHRLDEKMLSEARKAADLFFVMAEDSPPADGYLEEEKGLDVGGHHLAVAHTPGHSPGGVTIVGEGRAFCGDLVFYGSVGRTDLPGGSERVLRESIHRHIATLPDETALLPGHGPETTVGQEKKHNPFF